MESGDGGADDGAGDQLPQRQQQQQQQQQPVPGEAVDLRLNLMVEDEASAEDDGDDVNKKDEEPSSDLGFASPKEEGQGDEAERGHIREAEVQDKDEGSIEDTAEGDSEEAVSSAGRMELSELADNGPEPEQKAGNLDEQGAGGQDGDSHAVTDDEDDDDDDGRDDNPFSPTKDADGTAEGKVASDALTMTSDPAVSPEAQVDEDVDDFFSSGTRHPVAGGGQFPALENVYLESDEEGKEEKEVVKEKEEEEAGSDEGAGNGDVLKEGSDVACAEEALTATAAAGRGGGGMGDGGGVSQARSPHKDYPLNYQNYKVCREVGPGVKECLILETGEQVVCVAEKSSCGDDESTGETTPHLVLVSGSEEDRGRNARETTVITAETPSGNPQASGTNPSASCACVSFQKDDGQLDLNPQAVGLEGAKQAYITENGIPVILDNAEDDVKIGLQAEIGRLGMGGPLSGMSSKLPGTDSGDGGVGGEVVGDVLSSGGDVDSEGMHRAGKQTVKKSKRKREKKERFYELTPENALDSAEDLATMSESDANNNSSGPRENSSQAVSNGLQEEGEAERDMNNSANDRFNDISQSYREGRSRGSSRGYSHEVNYRDSKDSYRTSHIDSSYPDSRSFRSRDESSYFRSGEASSADSSRFSTRYSRVERADPKSESLRPESVTVPKFKTLHDQQVSWLDMFKMIEEQHRTELQTQYSEHQKILQDMQRNMERELSKQQDTLKHRLRSHREILDQLSPRSRQRQRDTNQSRAHAEVDASSSIDSQRSLEPISDATSHTTLHGVPVTLRNPPPLLASRSERSDVYDRRTSDQLPVKRSLEHELSSPSRPADTSLNRSRLVVGGDKQLRGGVYSSPMPLAKARHKNSPRSSRGHDDSVRSPRDKLSSNTNAGQWTTDGQGRREDRVRPGSADVSIAESDDVLSPRTRVSLREKHAKHLADLRAYYEEELCDMKRMLSSRQEGEVTSSAQSAGEVILANENQELRQKCQQLDDDYHDAKIEIRELQQKIQGLEIRSTDYAERYDTSQSQLLSLRSRLEELTEFAKEKELAAAEFEKKNKKNAELLHMSYKKEKDLSENLHNAKTTIERLVDKYETLEKDYQLLKESVKVTDEKLLSSRKEAMEVTNKLSRLQLDKQQLEHDNEVLKHELALARSAVNMRTSYEEAYQPGSSQRSGRSPSRTVASTVRSASVDRAYPSIPKERVPVPSDLSPESETDSSDFVSGSPIIKAERELKRLKDVVVSSSGEYMPKLQRKYYGTELSRPASNSNSISSSNWTNNKATSSYQPNKCLSPRDRKGRATPQGKEVSTRVSAPAMTRTAAHRDFNLTKERESDRILEVKGSKVKEFTSPGRKSGLENGLSGEDALQRIKTGDIVSRPAWEDIYTSLTPGHQSGGGGGAKLLAANPSREQILKERLQSIESLERKYDDLSNEKRRLESALSRVPVQGHHRDREKFETELDRVDRELGSVRMSLKRFHVLKSTI